MLRLALRFTMVAGILLSATACSSSTGSAPIPAPSETTAIAATDGTISHRDASYEIEGRVVVLVDGASEMEAAPGSASKITTRYFGNEATGDLNNDGEEDVAFLLTQESGGSGTFFYVVVALKTDRGYVGTNGVLLGDRVAPQSTEIQEGQLLVNYADRTTGEPMTAPPSVGVSRYFKIIGGRLTE